MELTLDVCGPLSVYGHELLVSVLLKQGVSSWQDLKSRDGALDQSIRAMPDEGARQLGRNVQVQSASFQSHPQIHPELALSIRSLIKGE